MFFFGKNIFFTCFWPFYRCKSTKIISTDKIKSRKLLTNDEAFRMDFIDEQALRRGRLTWRMRYF